VNMMGHLYIAKGGWRACLDSYTSSRGSVDS
jgi:hypothetical protein